MRNLVLSLLVVLSSSCSVPMRTVEHEHEIDVPVSAAWTVFSDFAAFAEWNALSVELKIAGSGVGMTRTMDIEGIGRISERLDKLDHEKKQLAYTLVEGTPLGMIEYHADVALHAAGKDRTLIKWHGEFDAAPGADLDTMAENLKGSYQGMSEALGRYVAATLRTGLPLTLPPKMQRTVDEQDSWQRTPSTKDEPTNIFNEN
ncbi:MAG: SRPBCC family protein [Pseudomonadales bacterium]